MAYNFLELVNKVANKINEVELTTLDFASSGGIYSDMKNGVNTAIDRINREEFEWPFNWNVQDQLLTVDQVKYSYPASAKTLAFDSFRLKGETSLNVETQRLKQMDYEEWLDKYADHEFNPSDHSDVPIYVARTRNLSYVLAPVPDKAYTIRYEYYSIPPQLSLHSDVPTIPEQFKSVIVEGAFAYVYLFKGQIEEASISEQRFVKAIDEMRKIYINRTEYMRSSVVRS